MTNKGEEYIGHEICLHIPNSTLKLWNKLRQTKASDFERFGVIVGCRTESTNEYWIEFVTTPFRKDKATRYSFLLQDEKHQNIVDAAFEKSGGTSVYMGIWHTHPENRPKPSITDMRDWLLCIKRNSGRQLFFVIAGLKETRVFIKNGFGFCKLSKVRKRR